MKSMTGWNYLGGRTPPDGLKYKSRGFLCPALERRRRRRVFLSAFMISKSSIRYLTLFPHFVPAKPIIYLHLSYEMHTREILLDSLDQSMMKYLRPDSYSKSQQFDLLCGDNVVPTPPTGGTVPPGPANTVICQSMQSSFSVRIVSRDH
jgi:hypothetical protein